MFQNIRLDSELPFCHRKEESKQTELSVGLRVTFAALGVIAIVSGFLVLLQVPGINNLGTTFGWTSILVGTLAVLAAISIKCVQLPSSKHRYGEGSVTDLLQGNSYESDFERYIHAD